MTCSESGNTKAALILWLAGPLRLVRATSGEDLTPRLVKAQGLLALLGSAPLGRRRRAWLQDKLWSDSEPKKGAANLRQAVLRLRQAMGPDQGLLIFSPGWIELDRAKVTVRIDPEPGDGPLDDELPEFCQGLDIDDPEFDDWIRDQRLAFEDRLAAQARSRPQLPIVARSKPAVPSRPILYVATMDAGDSTIAPLAKIIGVQAAMAVGRMGGALVRAGVASNAREEPDALQLAVCGSRLGSSVALHAQLTEADVILWSGGRTLKMAADGRVAVQAVEELVGEVTAAAAHQLGQGQPGTPGYQVRAAYRALERMFAMNEDGLAECERVLAATMDGPAAPVHRAWRAQLRAISVIERLAPDPDLAGREALDMIARSLREDPGNSIINAVAAELALLFEDRPLKAAHHAKLAVDQDPHSPFARTANAQALAWLGLTGKAHAEARRALRLAGGLPNQSFWLMRCCLTAVRSGNYAEAGHYAQLAHELAPRFKPPLRFLAGLRFHAGDEAGALRALQQLKALEPDFTLDLMVSDDYPTISLRNTPLIDVARSGIL